MSRRLRGLFAFTALGLLAELLLTAHWADAWQALPLALLPLGLLVLVVPVNRPVVWGTMTLLILAGLGGIALHYRGKVEFALERNQALGGWALVRESLKGTSPPILAPGAMIALGLLGLVAGGPNQKGHA